MDIIPNNELPDGVVRELRALGSRHVLGRDVTHRADVYFGPSVGPDCEAQWSRVAVSNDAYPALAAWFENDDREVEEWAQQAREAERTAELREIEDAGREESRALFEAHIAYWVDRGVSRAEAVNLANTWATPEYAHRARVKAWRENRRAERGRRPAANTV